MPDAALGSTEVINITAFVNVPFELKKTNRKSKIYSKLVFKNIVEKNKEGKEGSEFLVWKLLQIYYGERQP